MSIGLAYISSCEHLLSHILAVSFIAVCGTILSAREDVLKIRFEETFVSKIRQPCIRICGDLVVDVKVILSVLVQEQTTECGTVGHVDNLGQLLW